MYNSTSSQFDKERKDVPYHPRVEPKYDVPLRTEKLKEIFAHCSDLQTRRIFVGGGQLVQAEAFFLDGLVSGDQVASDVLRPLTGSARFGDVETEADAVLRMDGSLVYGASVQTRRSTDDAVTDILHGFCVVVFDGIQTAVSFETRTSNHRSISEPSSEQSVKGAKDCFVETLRVNSSLVRRHLRDASLKLEQTTIGRKSGTKVELFYVDGVASPAVVEQLQKRLDDIDIDGLITATSLESYICDSPLSPFPQLMNTERPDRFCLNLLEGRVGLLVDGLPIGWLLPATMSQQLRVPDDVSKHAVVASAITLLRHLGLILAILFPAVYVSIAMYHQEMIPTQLLLSVIESKQQVPFSTAMEILGMLLAFELLQEAGLRLPKSIGDTVSIIGALVVGQSAVEAKVVSPIAVIVVATAGIAGYTIPNQDLSQALRLTRFALVIAALLAGMYGVAAGCILLVYHLCTLDSFGLAYLSPVADGNSWAILRAIFQTPARHNLYRTANLQTPDRRRAK